jgi:hypothetical protein
MLSSTQKPNITYSNNKTYKIFTGLFKLFHAWDKEGRIAEELGSIATTRHPKYSQ